MKRLLYLLFCFLLFILNFNIVSVSATAGLSLDALVKSDTAKKLYQHVLADGGSPYWAATAVGNANAESGLDTKASGSYWGAFQFQSGKSTFQSWCKKNNRDEYDICAQYDWLYQYRSSGTIKGLTGLSADEIKKDTKYIKDATSAAAYWALGMEGCVCWSGISVNSGHIQDSAHNGNCQVFDFSPSGSKYKSVSLQNLKDRTTTTAYIYKAFSGLDPEEGGKSSASPGSSESSKSNVVATLGVGTDGFYSEESISAYCKLHEISLDDILLGNATRDTLCQEDLRNLESWHKNVDESSLSSRALKFLRNLVTICGFALTVYTVLLYLGFWFDRSNIFFDIGVVKILTLGHLHTAIEDEDSNFTFQGWKEKKIAVAHKQIIIVCLVCLIFGVLILTGRIYTILLSLINLVYRLIGI